MTGASPVTTILFATAWQSHTFVYSSDRACPCHDVHNVIVKGTFTYALSGSHTHRQFARYHIKGT